jgi:protein-tyrosine-phosphatase
MKVLFVCDGNICRSPMAAEYLRHRAVREGLSHVVVDSAGVLGIEGVPAAPFSIEVARDAGLDLTRHRSRGVTIADMRTADLVLTMTLTQLERLSRRYPPSGQRRLLLRAFEGGPTPSGGAPELDDPVAGPIEGYRDAFGVIRTCVDHLVMHLRNAP